MTTQSNAELREAILTILLDNFGGLAVLATERRIALHDLTALFQSQQRQLLQGLMEHKKEFESRIDDVPVYLHAVPISVIQNKLEGLS